MSQQSDTKGTLKALFIVIAVVALFIFVPIALSGNMPDGFFGTVFISIIGGAFIVLFMWILFRSISN